MFITIRIIIFFKSIIGLIQIFGRVNFYFYRLNFRNIKIIIYIFKKFSKFGREGHGPPPFNTAPPLGLKELKPVVGCLLHLFLVCFSQLLSLVHFIITKFSQWAPPEMFNGHLIYLLKKKIGISFPF